MWGAFRRSTAAVLFVLVQAAAPGSDRLPVRWFTVADGLPRDRVLSILEDSRGFLWIGTAGGLARFDGRDFAVYGIDDGLPGLDVEALIETGGGRLFVATEAGVARLRVVTKPGEPPFERVFAGDRHGLTGGGATRVYWGATDGLYAMDENGSRAERVVLSSRRGLDARVWDVHLDRRGALWLAYDDRIVRRLADRSEESWQVPSGTLLRQANGWWTKFFEDPDGGIWVGTPGNGLWHLAVGPLGGFPLVDRIYTGSDGLPYNQVRAMIVTADGTMWVATPEGVAKRVTIARSAQMRFEAAQLFDAGNGHCVNTLLSDRTGNLWIGTDTGGLARIAGSGFVSTKFPGSVDHPNDLEVNQVLELSGRLVTLGRDLVMHARDGAAWTSFLPKSAIPSRDRGWGWNQIAAQGRDGDFWLVAGLGLLRWTNLSTPAALAGRAPDRVYDLQRGLKGVEAFRIFIDSRGDVWAGVFPSVSEPGLVRLDRKTDTFLPVPVDGLASGDVATAFAEDAAGDVWIGFYSGRVRRFRSGRMAGWDDGIPGDAGLIENIARDHLGDLWIATASRGVVRVDAVDSDAPRFSRFGHAQGLAIDQTRCVAEGPDGRIYVGTTRGVDRLDAATGLVQHFTAAEGLAGNEVKTAYRDGGGQLWFGTVDGLSRYVPHAGAPPPPPVAYLTSLRVGGDPRLFAALPGRAVSGLRIGPDERDLEIAFTSPDFRPGGSLRFQTMLVGADTNWREPTTERSISYAHLAPGAYRFAVRAVDAEQGSHGEPADVAFEVLAPFWRQSWFLVAVGAATLAVASIVYRARVERLLEVERLRTRIASDLHDDIGSGLSRIAILSEVARRELPADNREAGRRLASIASASGELVDAMSDIVWAINPRRDRLGDLVHRMRRIAGDLVEGAAVELAFTAPATELDTRLGDDVRRQVLLIYKEAMHNVLRHSGCSRIDVGVALDRDGLGFSIRDDGRGFDTTADSDGHGLMSMRQRALAIGATFSIVSTPGAGTTVALRAMRPRGSAARPYANAQERRGRFGRIWDRWGRGRT
jgi:signal transduction histidine kinase/ligand-binding sensor domain-containing protein